MPTPTSTAPVAGLTPAAPVLAVPASVEAAAASAVGTVQSVAASVASATAEVLGSFANGSLGATSSTEDGGASQHQPVPAPLAAPAGSGFFSLLSMGGGGQLLGSSSGFAPLLVGILTLLGTVLLRRDFRSYLVSWEMPKPSSALLRPLERPG